LDDPAGSGGWTGRIGAELATAAIPQSLLKNRRDESTQGRWSQFIRVAERLLRGV
jgi:hypothetical protein